MLRELGCAYMGMPLCLYHKNCIDGYLSAAIVCRKEGRVECRPIQYGQGKTPNVLNRKVYIVDFGFPLDRMKKIHEDAKEVIWIDHHRTWAPVAAEFPNSFFDESECGSSLTWKTLFPDEAPPPIIEHVKDRDLWLWRDPRSRAITAGLVSFFKHENLRDILEVDLNDMEERGQILLDEQERRIQQSIRSGVKAADPYGQMGKTALVVVGTTDLNELGERACQSVRQGGAGCDMLIAMSLTANGEWIHSLRSTKGQINCEPIASNRGGGGHPAAASYRAKMPFPMSDDCLNWPL